MISDLERARLRLIEYKDQYAEEVALRSDTANNHPNHHHRNHAIDAIQVARNEYLERLEFYIRIRIEHQFLDDLLSL